MFISCTGWWSASCDTAAEAKADELLADELLSAGPDEHGLTRDEIAAIHLYTQELLYRPLNREPSGRRRAGQSSHTGLRAAAAACPVQGAQALGFHGRDCIASLQSTYVCNR